MKYLPLIAAALWRRPVETILTFLAVTAGFMLFASMMGLNVTYRRAVEGVPDDRLLVVPAFPVPRADCRSGWRSGCDASRV